MKAARYGNTDVRWRRSPAGWHVMVGTLAVCSFHGQPHIHGHTDRAHPDHPLRVSVDPGLDLGQALRRIRALCESLPGDPTLAQLTGALR